MDEFVSVAPMMEISDRHWRYMLRGLTKKSVLYTEMVVDDAVNHSPNLDFFIGKDVEENPSVVQLGGHNPDTLAVAAEKVQLYGGEYNEINLNCGCPSPRVSKRSFGAKLMLEPELVREIVSKMSRRVNMPVTVKCRIGIDGKDSYEELCKFISAAHDGGAGKFIIHSRKCIMKGLSAKQNRDIPPLKYEVVHRLVREFPDLKFVLNGGILNFTQALSHLDDGGYLYENETLPPVHGVMIGRAAYNNPLLFASADSTFFGCRDPGLSRRQLLERYISYCEWAQSPEGPRKLTTALANKAGGNSISSSSPSFSGSVASTSILLKPVHSVMNGLHHCTEYKKRLNDLYVERVQRRIIAADGETKKSFEAVSSIAEVGEEDYNSCYTTNNTDNIHYTNSSSMDNLQSNFIRSCGFVDDLTYQISANSQPSCREIIEGACEVMKEEDLDAPLGCFDRD